MLYHILPYCLTSVTTGMRLIFSSFLCLRRKKESRFSATTFNLDIKKRFFKRNEVDVLPTAQAKESLPGVVQLSYKNISNSVLHLQFQTRVAAV